MATKGSGIYVVGFDEEQKFDTSIHERIIESIQLFEDLSTCVLFIEQQANADQVVVLITTTTKETQLRSFESLLPIEAILILSTIDKDIEKLPSKVIGIYPEIEILLQSLSKTLNTIEQQLNVKSALFSHQTDGKDNFDFYFYHLWKNDRKDLKSSKKSLVDQARLFFLSNDQIHTCIDHFKTSYKSNDILLWLDQHQHPFPYHLLLSKALRIHDQEILSLTRFFLDDLTKQMKPAESNENDEVYLGTQLPIYLIDQLEQRRETDTITFHCFLPVTRSKASALLEATQFSRRPKMTNVLFKFDIKNALCVTLDDTLLIDIATPFHITSIARGASTSNGRQLLTIIKLIAMNQDHIFEEFLQRQNKLGRTLDDLYKKMRDNISDDETLADERIARGEWSSAATILARIINPTVRVLNKYGCLLREHLDNLPDALNYHQQALLKAINREKAETLIYLGLVYTDMKQYADAYQVHSEALKWFESEKKRDPTMIARCLVGLGSAQWGRHQLDEALRFTERALTIREKEIKPRDDFAIAACLSNIGNILHDKGNIQRALSYATRAVNLLNTSGKVDARFAATLNNLGAMYQTTGDLIKAREYFQRALECFPNGNHLYRESILANLTRLNTIEQQKKE